VGSVTSRAQSAPRRVSTTGQAVPGGASIITVPRSYQPLSRAKRFRRRITGGERQQCVTAGGALFILLDSFSGDLDPSENSDGTYVPVDVAYIRRAMADKPELLVFLCAHYFDFALESAEFKALLAEEQRIKALFMGHDHLTNVSFTPEDAGRLPILRTGHFSYSCDDTDYATAYRGWRELLLHPDGSFESYYFIPRQYIPARDTYTGEHIRDEYTYRSR